MDLASFVLGIDVGRHKGRDGVWLERTYIRDRYVGGGGTKQETVVIDTKIK